MNRTARAFQRRFSELLGNLGARQRSKGIEWLFTRARRKSRGSQSESRALTDETIYLLGKLHRYQRRKTGNEPAGCPLLFCDAGLGGLARWLRASGCEALWVRDISDADLVQRATDLNAVIITTDSFLLDRRAIVNGDVRAVWVPPSLNRFEQLRLVRAELNLPQADPDTSRCMRCGGELTEISPEEVQDRIPPRTWRWVKEYYECRGCGQLFWKGTHWQRVTTRLRESQR